jgi:hypothetical protein
MWGSFAMKGNPKIIEDTDEHDGIILRVEGESNYFSYCGYNRVELSSTSIDISHDFVPDTLSPDEEIYNQNTLYTESLSLKAVCSQESSCFQIIGDPETTTKEIDIQIGKVEEQEKIVKWWASFIWTRADEPLSQGYTSDPRGRWGCSINVPADTYDKLVSSYRSNRIASLDISISAKVGEYKGPPDIPNFETSQEGHLWRLGPSSLPVDYSRGETLYIRPDQDYITAHADATISSISFREPNLTTHIIEQT